jgi:enoyl-CoA hydratase
VSDPILIEREGQIATVILNRPRQRNAITLAMWGQLIDIARQLDADPEVRVVILRGSGDNAFSAGADISEFESYRSNSAQAREYAKAFDGALDAVAAIGQPTISLIRGFCVGGGLELATATDLRIASDDSRFGVPIAQLGILVGYKEMRRLVALVGPGAAMDLLLTARLINGGDALRIGIISELTPADDVERVTYSLARHICSLAPLSARRHKEILQTVLTNPGLAGLSPEEQALPFACFDTEDFQEGRRAFLDKRPPHFRGK